MAQAVSDLLALAVAQTEAGGKLAARKRFRQRRGQEGGKVGRAAKAVLGFYADENLIVNAPAAPPPTATAVVAARFLNLDEQYLQRELRISNESGDAHKLVENVEDTAAFRRAAAAEHGGAVAVQPHDPLLRGDWMHQAHRVILQKGGELALQLQRAEVPRLNLDEFVAAYHTAYRYLTRS